MFDVGFQELLLLAIVALIVVGPERLPALARTLGMWIGRGKRMARNLKDDIDAELKADELKRILEEQKISNPMEEIIEESKDSIQQIKEELEAPIKQATAAEQLNLSKDNK